MVAPSRPAAVVPAPRFRDGNTIAGATTSTFVPTQAGAYTAGISIQGVAISQAVNITAGFASIAAPAAQYCVAVAHKLVLQPLAPLAVVTV